MTSSEPELWKIMNKHKSSRISRGFSWVKPERPFILFLTKKDWGSCSLRLSRAIRKYTDWDSACVSYWAGNVLKSELVAKHKCPPHIRSLMAKADVIIYGASWYAWNPLNVPINKDAYLGVWHIGSGYRGEHKLYAEKCHPNVDFCFCSEDLQRLEKDTIPLQVAYDVESFEVPNRPDEPIVVGHSPSGRGKAAYAGRQMKGTKHLILAMDRLKKKYGNKIELDIIQDVEDYDECLKRKSRCHIFYDSIQEHDNSLSMHGISTIEAAAYSSVCICRTDFHDSPIIDVKNADDIYNVIDELMQDKEKMKRLGKETREWSLRVHGYEVVAKKLISIIESKMLGDSK